MVLFVKQPDPKNIEPRLRKIKRPKSRQQQNLKNLRTRPSDKLIITLLTKQPNLTYLKSLVAP